MNAFSRYSLTLLSLAGLARGQSVSTPPKDGIVHLDALVVTGATDPRAAFDLAQGASVLTDERLRLLQQASLGETLSSLPGVSSTYYGPGASRPMIRGLGGDRVRMLDNGVGSLDASNVSPDHAVSVEPLLVDRIEVLRGPATLLYGSSAIGGVVNVIDNRIPTAPFSHNATGRAEVRYDTGSNERTGVFAVGGGNQSFGVQVTGLRTETDDVDIPGFARSDADAPADQVRGTLPSSDISTKSGSVGGTWFAGPGSLGASVSELHTIYGVPVGDDPAISIDLRQRRFDLRGQTELPGGWFKSANVRFGVANYEHSELSGGTTVNTTFKNNAYEGRAELQQTVVGAWSGTVGAQASRSDFSAVGEEVVTAPTVTTSRAVFALEEYRFPHASVQVGGRYEYQRVALGVVPDGLPDFAGWQASTGETRSGGNTSVSTGVVVYPATDYSLGLSAAFSQRAPTAQELFSNGPHGGTGAYEVGTSTLGREKSVGLDLTLRKRAGFLTGSVGAFVNEFKGFIYEEELPAALTPVDNNPDGLTPYQFVAADARFLGGEAEGVLHLIDDTRQTLHLVLGVDYVRAENRDTGTALPRIPPLRTRAEVRYARGGWSTGVNVTRASAQTRFTEEEGRTDGYTLVGADAAYAFDIGALHYVAGVRAANLGDEEARVSTSFLKDFAPLPGRTVTVSLRAEF